MADDAEIGRLVQERAINRKALADVEERLNRLTATVTQYLQNPRYERIDLEILKVYPQVAEDLDEWRNLDTRLRQISADLMQRGLE